MKVTLTVVKGPTKGQAAVFSEPRGFIVGRAGNTDFPLPESDPYVARRHLYLEICPPSCRVQNLSSTNVAHLNGEPITAPRELTQGDLLELGYTQFQVSIETHVVPVVAHCRSCGRPVEVILGEAQPDRCEACVAESRAAKAKQEAFAAQCVCGADLTERANSDGRARELAGIVEYACEQHVPKNGETLRIGPYETCRQLGEGAFGAVYLAYHRPTARLVAVKQLKDLRQAELVKRFQREMQLLEQFTHPNVVRCIDTGVDDKGAPYLVTEHVAAGSLQALVDRSGGRLPRDQAVHLVVEALSGLSYIHAQQVVHRDIKPDNILLQAASNGQPGRTTPKLADFGLAFSFARAGGTRLTKQGTRMGTLMYMAPEQVKNTADVRAPADVYSMGVTLYYLLSGRYTFAFPTPADVAAFAAKVQNVSKHPKDLLPLLMEKERLEHPFVIILKDEPTPILKGDSSLPKDLAEVVDRAVRKDASARFQSASEFQAALRDAARSIS
jgi:serine/threonine-protein kinase